MNLFSTAAAIAALQAFANTNAKGRLFISPTPQQFEMSRADFEALTDWIEVKSLGSHGETGTTTNMVTYDTWDTSVTQKGKGVSDGGSPEIEVARIPTDPGQNALRAAAKTNLNYAFRMIRNDPSNIGGTGTILYNRGLVVGPRRPHGRNEDFDLEIFTIGNNQEEITVDPTAAGAAPANTAVPVITTDGTPASGETITTSTGTFTGDAVITYAYQWFAAGVPIQGATANSLLLTAAEVEKTIFVRVTATNASGSAQAYSAPTAAVIAGA